MLTKRELSNQLELVWYLFVWMFVTENMKDKKAVLSDSKDDRAMRAI